MIEFQQATFLISAAKVEQLPPDTGVEVAIVGRSNAGKSSVLNILTGQKQLARTSKTPGRTQLINLFSIDDKRRLVDLPGYGFAKVAESIKIQWQKTLSQYLQERKSLKGLLLVMDCRHPFRDTDCSVIDWCLESNLPCHILLNKADKLSYSQQKTCLMQAEKAIAEDNIVSVQLFSTFNRLGVDTLKKHLQAWYKI
ncbi:MAG: ribosome biogenesis GTP-binding protein YihA/YsxC [Gammaproteobacteria bacterium]|nr:ribosome biogenesis GTP-binding protein YihA/YsxC [Gammaproteobacteria bacterium]